MAPSPSPTPTHAAFRVEDMTCSHCEAAIREALADALPGAAVEIDMGRHLVTVQGDRETAAAALREAGYEPEPVAR